MPWHISRNAKGCSGFAVVKDADGKIVGCHPTLEKANAQLAALHINVKEGANEIRVFENIDLANATFATEESTGRMTAKIDILKVGRSANPRIYRESAVRGAAEDHIFDGARMYVDHRLDLPPMKRSLADMVAAVESTEYNPKRQMLEGTAVFFNKDFYEFAQRAKDYMGTSIRALCRGQRVKEPSTGTVVEDIDQILQAHSVDWVVYPAAGGSIQAFESETEGEDVDWDKITVEELTTNAPDLVQAILATAEKKGKEKPADGTPTAEQIATQVAEQVTTALKQRDDAAIALAKKQADVLKQVTEAVGKSGLPEVVRKRLITTLSVSETFDEAAVTKAVTEAKEEIRLLGSGPRITGQGASQEAGNFTEHPSGISVHESLSDEFGVPKPGKKDDKGKEEPKGKEELKK